MPVSGAAVSTVGKSNMAYNITNCIRQTRDGKNCIRMTPPVSAQTVGVKSGPFSAGRGGSSDHYDPLAIGLYSVPKNRTVKFINSLHLLIIFGRERERPY